MVILEGHGSLSLYLASCLRNMRDSVVGRHGSTTEYWSREAKTDYKKLAGQQKDSTAGRELSKIKRKLEE